MDHPPRRTLLACLLGGALATAVPGARAQALLRITAIPDEAPTELARKAAPLLAHLEHQLGVKASYVPVTDYAAAVEALVARKVDLAWLGGLTFVQARRRSAGQVLALVQREEDTRFRSVFVTHDAAVHSLADLRGRDLAFGSPSSTSGHLMPRSALLAAGIEPERDCRRVAFSGAHDATVAAVASGRVAAGALNASVWDKLVAEGRVDASKVRVFHTTAPYVDYTWAVHAAMPAAQREALAGALLALDRGSEEGRIILDLQRATRFVPARAEAWEPIERAARAAGLL